MNQGQTWDESWLELDADELYLRCARLQETPSPERHSFTFHQDSSPYLVATELPWLGFPDEHPAGRSVLTIAGSGDLPLFFRFMRARRVMAVDVSRYACFFSELKRSALRRLEWRECLAFFLADLAGAGGFLSSRGVSTSLSGDKRWRFYERVRTEMSRAARAQWDRIMRAAVSGDSPFRSFRGLAGLSFLEHIPYLASEEAYEAWREQSAPYPILHLPLQQAVASARISVDILYLSNVIEYWREDHRVRDTHETFLAQLERFLPQAWDLLSPGGHLYFYFFQSRAGRDLESIRRELAVLRRRGGSEEAFEILTECSSIPGSRFRHTLLRYLKPSAS